MIPIQRMKPTISRLSMERAARWLLLIFCGMNTSLLTGFSQNANSSIHQAGLVVQFGDGSTETRCVQFSEESITGYELLVRSEIPFIAAFSSVGAAICKIGEVGCSENDCFCQSPPNYWSYWQLNGENWIYSLAGASSSQVVHGKVEGWRWGSGIPPDEVIPLETICAQPSATPTSGQSTSTKTPTNSPSPTCTHTLTLTHTPTLTKSPTLGPTYGWVVEFTDAPLVVVQLPTETTSIASLTATPSPVTPSSTTTPTLKLTSKLISSFTPTTVPTTTSAQTTQENPTNTLDVSQTAAFSIISTSPIVQHRKPEITLTPTLRKGLQKSQSSPLALAPADDTSTPQGEGGQSRPKYVRFALLTGGVIGYFVFLFLFGSLVVGLIVVWMVKRK